MTNETAVAEKLLQINAIKLNPHEPYTWASGWKSPIYCDNRKILSYPYIRDFIKSELCNVVFEQFPDADMVAGVATAGISWGAMVADQLKLPFIYVRPKAKEHGLGNQIEGDISQGKRVVVIEDLISTGMSSLKVVDVLKNSGVEIEGMVSIFNYGFPQAVQAFQEKSVTWKSLTNYPVLLQLAKEKGIIDSFREEILLKWQENPSEWTGN
jgi:orotate phosphoribosyltransferase